MEQALTYLFSRGWTIEEVKQGAKLGWFKKRRSRKHPFYAMTEEDLAKVPDELLEMLFEEHFRGVR